MRVSTTLSLSLLIAFAGAARDAGADVVALRGATLIDLSGFGREQRDIDDALVLIEGERILAAGHADEIELPAGARVIDARGKYLVPGLVDTFSVQNNEAQARAHLYMGVTTVFYNELDGRRGLTQWVPDGPTLKGNGWVSGYDQSALPLWDTPGELRAGAPPLDAAQLRGYVDAQRWNGYAALLLYYPLDAAQTTVVAQRMRDQRLIAIGEIGHSGTLASARAGVPLLVHASRYLIDLAPDELRRAVADDPFGPTRARYLQYLKQLDPASPEVERFARALAAESAALVPTFAMFELDLPGHANPWKEPVAAILDPDDIMLPADPATGEPPAFGRRSPTEFRAQVQALVALHRTLAKHRVKFVVGSGADAFGVLPGLGAHVEMEALVRIGLTPREALAAATQNLSSLVDFVDYGVVRAGARADLLLLEADPREDVRNVRRIATLIVRGREVDRAALLRTPLNQLAP
jgi:hypothetical protein